MTGTDTIALVMAAGRGERAGGDAPKQFARIDGRSVLAHAVDALLAHPAVGSVQVVIGEGQEAAYHAAVGDRALPTPVIGGAARAASVRAGLDAITGRHVLIHDAARPFLPAAVIDRLLGALESVPAAVPVMPVVDTLARDGDGLGDVVDRAGLWRVQTPQAFHLAAIRAAHRDWRGTDATDDAQVARAAGLYVATVTGDPMLDKLTYPADLAAAESRIATRMISRTGLGFDVHVFQPGDHVMLGGLAIPHSHGLAGHSDADVVLHAIVDALLGTIGAGDIGTHFPPTDPRWRGAASSRFVAHARGLIEAQGGRIDHVDVTVIGERPKVGPHRVAIQAAVAGMLGLSPGAVSIKATTTERLGFTGRGEGLAAQAVATVRIPEGS